MRFKHQQKFAFTDTSRKRSALRRKQQKERESLPLFAEIIAADQPSEDQVMRDRAERWAAQEVRDRKRHADKWREARAEIASHSANERAAIRHAWNCAPYPATPIYLLDFLHELRVGRYDLNHLPFSTDHKTDQHGQKKMAVSHAQPPVQQGG